ncbi:MAG: CD225/dispanin family protein [Muribaculaceae bacterium]|nr:CD225/dispanin family protein [Muribaculaceae bacterium]
MKFWIYQDGAQKGPFTVFELFEKNLTPQTPVWCEGMDKWRHAGEVPALGPLLDGNRDFYLSESGMGEVKAEDTNLSAQTACETPAAEPVAAESEAPGVNPAPQAAAQPAAAVRPAKSRPDEPCPPTYIGWSVFLTVCCCSPISIAALVCSIFVPSYYNKGKLDKSRRASEIAAWLIMIAIALGMLPVMLMSAIF